MKRELVDSFDETIIQAIDENGVISGERFIDTWFPLEKYGLTGKKADATVLNGYTSTLDGVFCK